MMRPCASSHTSAVGVAAALAGLAVVCWAPVLHAATLDPRGVQSETFSNGLRLIVCPDPDASTVAVEVIVKAGSADEPPDQRGIAHLLEHVLWSGAGAGDDDPRLRVEAIGGTINGGTLRDFTRFYAAVPAGRLEVAVEALASVVVGSAIAPAVVARERDAIGQEVALREGEPRTVLSDAAFAGLYGAGSPYGSPVEGNAADLSKISDAELALFRDTWYVPNNMAVIVSGSTRFEAARIAVDRGFGGLAPSPVPARATVAASTGAREGERLAGAPADTAYVMAAFAGPEASDRTAVCASDLLATLLAHDPVGRLVAELRDKRGIASEVGVDFLTQRQRSLFGIWAVCEPSAIEDVKQGIKSALAQLAHEPVAPRELLTAKRLLAAGYAFANETPADRASTLGFYEAIDSYRTATSYLPWVMDLLPQAVVATAARYTGEPEWIIVAPEGAGQ